ncbi:MAG: gliding motility protein [Myxococcales bacterium]|nr:gliding motility protein [Myxococcales bacterium]
MVQFNLQRRELTLKVVYYGPALSGKTTNLQALHKMAPRQGVGRLMTLETRDDRTLFFDLLPVVFKSRSGFQLKLKVLTVPGQVMHNSTRRVVLQGADAVAFVADSQITETEANKESFRNLQENLTANGLPPDLPLVIQFNKRDLPGIRSDSELAAFARHRKTPLYKSIAIEGLGVRETLEGLLTVAWDGLEQRVGLGQKLRVDRDAFLAEVFQDWGPPQSVIGG